MTGAFVLSSDQDRGSTKILAYGGSAHSTSKGVVTPPGGHPKRREPKGLAKHNSISLFFIAAKNSTVARTLLDYSNLSSHWDISYGVMQLFGEKIFHDRPGSDGNISTTIS